ncbi:Ig-like domain-containing protein [Agromyces archimandritae]|uniref:Ig-like domain repeat protein n=1 Tax=Agromyces archimandritae TaxID=2781962 RepID=A0A975FLD9_9MICO|nr:Ig-like domain-containing protein [Agromyces archimandritae]QTX03583.1 Ig-like domain repeat protein [Agromyces archimandritae]
MALAATIGHGVVTITFQAFETTTAVVLDDSTIPYGGTLSGTVTVTSDDGANAPTGSVTVFGAGFTITVDLVPGPAGVSTGTFEDVAPDPAQAVGGPYTVEASYSQTGAHGESSGSTEYTVEQASTTTIVEPSAPEFSFGTEVGGTIELETDSATLPTGTLVVTLLSGGTPAATQTIRPVSASNAFAFEPPIDTGEYTVHAAFAPDSGNFAGSSGTAAIEVVTATDTEVALALDDPEVTWNESFTGTITVSAGGALYDAAATAVHLVIDGSAYEVTRSGVGTYTFDVALPVGQYLLQATFDGDANASDGVSDSLDGEVVRASSETVATVSPTVAENYPVPVTGEVTVHSDAGSASGDAQLFVFDAAGEPVGAPVDGEVVDGQVSFEIPAGLEAGDYTVQIVYAGTADVAGSASSRMPFEVVATAVAFDIDIAAGLIFNDPVSGTVTLTLQGLATGDPEGTGSLTITGPGGPYTIDGLDYVGQGDGTAVATIPTDPAVILVPGSYHAVAAYDGRDTTVPANTSTSQPFTVAKAATETSGLTLPTDPTYGTDVIASVTVTNVSGTAAGPGGPVVFTFAPETGTPITVTGQLNAAGVAVSDAVRLAAGNYEVTAVYAENGEFLGSSTGPVELVVVQATSNVTVAATPSSVEWSGSPTLEGLVTTDPSGIYLAQTDGVTIAVTGPVTVAPFTVDVADDGTFSATPVAQTFPVGSYSVTATYRGTGDIAGSSTQQASAFDVLPAPTTTTISPDATSFPYGSAVTGRVNVAAQASGVVPPVDGHADVTISGNGIPPVTVRVFSEGPGVASFTIPVQSPPLPRGEYTLVATFADSQNYGSSTSAESTITIGAAPTETLITSVDPDPVDYPHSTLVDVTITAPDSAVPPSGGELVLRIGTDVVRVDAGTGTPTGHTLVFEDIVLPTEIAGAGSWQVTATYEPSEGSDFEGSEDVTNVVVSPAPTTTTLNLDRSAYFEGQLAEADGRTTSEAPLDLDIPDGSEVTVAVFTVDDTEYENPLLIEYVETTSEGDVTGLFAAGLDLAGLAPGDYVAVARFTGAPNVNFARSVSDRVAFTIIPSFTTTTTVTADASVVWGQPIGARGEVVGEEGTPQGTMVFRLVDAAGDVVYTFPAVPVVDGDTGQLTLVPDWSLVPPGEYTLTGEYVPEPRSVWAGSSGEAPVAVVGCASQTVLTIDPNRTREGATVTATAEVTGITPGCTASPEGGTVEFFLDGESIGTSTVNSPAVLDFEAPAPGTYEVTARFLGTTGLGASASLPVELVVIAAPTPGPTPGPLPGTGVDPLGTILGAGVLFLGGLALVLVRRRRRLG